MRSHAEQRAGIALHAAHDPLQEDMRGIHSRATIVHRTERASVQQCLPSRCIATPPHPVRSRPIQVNSDLWPHARVELTGSARRHGQRRSGTASCCAVSGLQGALTATARVRWLAAKLCCRADAQRDRDHVHGYGEEELQLDAQHARRCACGSRSRSLDLLAATRLTM